MNLWPRLTLWSPWLKDSLGRNVRFAQRNKNMHPGVPNIFYNVGAVWHDL